MKLRRLELDGFGKLVNQTYDFCPGLNLIYGPNEAGKSTLQRAIFTGLFGFFDEGSLTAAKKAVMIGYYPWDTRAHYGLKLVFETEKGSQYRVERTFSPDTETLLYDHKNGKNVSGKFTSATYGRLYFADKLLGMSKEVFENTSLVRQAELAALEKSATAITDTLLRLSASASQESTASGALQLLETALKEQVGTSRSRNKPLPEAQRRLEGLQNQRTNLQSDYQTLANQMHELAQAVENFERLQHDRDKADYQRLLAQHLIVSQQRLTIQQQDAEVERCREVVAKYQRWATFPADTQPKIQRSAAQYERAQIDTSQAEKAAKLAQRRLPSFCAQLDNLQKTINLAEPLRDLPDLAAQSAAEAGSSLQTWLSDVFSSLHEAIQCQLAPLAQTTQNLVGLNRVGHEGIAQDRQAFGRLVTDLLQAKQAIRQIQQDANQAGLPEERWESILQQAQTDAAKWHEWSQYPVHLRDELLQLSAQYDSVSKNPKMDAKQAADFEGRLSELQTQFDTLQKRAADLENVRSVPHNEKSRIQEIASQLQSAKQAHLEAQKRYNEIDPAYQRDLQEFEAEKQALYALDQIGVAGLNQIQRRWIGARQQLAVTQTQFAQAQDAWNKVGMPGPEYEKLEKTVKEIQSGIRPAPKPRPGCRSLLKRKQAKVIDQTPTEFRIYAQVQPIFSEYSRLRGEIEVNEGILHQIEGEIHQQLGRLVPPVIQDNTFVTLLEQIQNYQQKAFRIEQRKGLWEAHHAQYQQTAEHVQQIQERLVRELQHFGFTEPDLDIALNHFYQACEKKEQLLAIETAKERLEAQIAMIKQQSDHLFGQQQSLAQTEMRITDLLAKVSIQIQPGQVQEGLKRFNEGLEKHQQWLETQKRLEQLQRQISDFGRRLATAQAEVKEKEENFRIFKEQLVQKYAPLLPNDFADQNLAQLDADLQSHSAAQSKIEKAQDQLEQLQLQADALQRDFKDWSQKAAAAEQMGNDLSQAINAAGVEVGDLSVVEAIKRFETAVEAFSNWQQANRAYEAALQSQQAVRAGLTDLDEDTANLEVKLATISKQHPEWKSLTVSDRPEVYERNFQKLNEQVLQERDHTTHLRDTVDRGSKDLRHLAELDEEIALASADVQLLSNFSQTIELATRELTEATSEYQKIFAPRLERIVNSGLEQISAGRYRQVKIDPNSLEIQVLAPERKEWVDAKHFSTGTRDMIYLLLRVGIAQLMSSSGEKLPILLDDPLVEFDEKRQKAALEYIKKLAQQTQVFLFTKDLSILNLFTMDKRPELLSKVIELKAP